MPKACSSCLKRHAKSLLRRAPCGHVYCFSCLQRMARAALEDRALIPVRCCQIELPIEYVEHALSKDAFARYLAHFRERAWQSSDLLSDAEYARVVSKIGAKQCPGCGIGVLRDYGCVHMKCPNGHEFCFTCLRVWHSCNCELIPSDELRGILGD